MCLTLSEKKEEDKVFRSSSRSSQNTATPLFMSSRATTPFNNNTSNHNGIGSRRNFSTSTAKCEPAVGGAADELGFLETLKLGLENNFVPHLVQAGDIEASGLSGANPAAMLRHGIEWVCINGDLSWAGGIVVTTIALKLALAPLAVLAQKNTIKMHNCIPEAKVIQDRLKACKDRGDQAGVQKAAMSMGDLYKKNDCHPVKGLGLILAQMPVFMSFFFALRGMALSADTPIPSLMNGGAYWFHDLTAADPLHILPVLSIASMAVLIETAGAGTMTPGMKMGFRAFFVVILGVTYDFPAAVFLYWVTNNCLSLVQASLLKIPVLQRAAGIPEKAVYADDAKTKEENSFSFSKAMEAYKDTEKAEKFVENDGAKVSREAAIASLKRHHNERKKKRSRR